MNPLIVIFLILIGIAGAYFLATNWVPSQFESTGAADNAIAAYGPLAGKILVAVLILYGVYYLVDVVKTTIAERKAKERAREARAREARNAQNAR